MLDYCVKDYCVKVLYSDNSSDSFFFCTEEEALAFISDSYHCWEKFCLLKTLFAEDIFSAIEENK